jgi:hypothetical protein
MCVCIIVRLLCLKGSPLGGKLTSQLHTMKLGVAGSLALMLVVLGTAKAQDVAGRTAAHGLPNKLHQQVSVHQLDCHGCISWEQQVPVFALEASSWCRHTSAHPAACLRQNELGTSLEEATRDRGSLPDPVTHHMHAKLRWRTLRYASEKKLLTWHRQARLKLSKNSTGCGLD